MEHEIENRAYEPNSTPEEILALKDRVSFYDDEIVLYKETPVQTEFQLDICFKQIEDITSELSSFFLIIDLTEAQPPSANIRSLLRLKFMRLKDKLPYVALYTGKNFMLNLAAKFVLSNLDLKAFSIFKTKKEAIGSIAQFKLDKIF